LMVVRPGLRPPRAPLGTLHPAPGALGGRGGDGTAEGEAAEGGAFKRKARWPEEESPRGRGGGRRRRAQGEGEVAEGGEKAEGEVAKGEECEGNPGRGKEAGNSRRIAPVVSRKHSTPPDRSSRAWTV
jgi:hypothetical protein